MLALIAGSGRLPTVLRRSHDGPVHVVSLENFPPDELVPDRVFCIEHLGTLLQDLKADGVTEVCFAGAIGRPTIDPAKIDAATMPLVPAMMAALGQGDDGALRIVVTLFEEAGFTVRAAQDIAPGLLPGSGVLGAVEPSEQARGDAGRAIEIVAAMSAADVGQACVVHRGQALAVEGQFGTDWMLSSLRQRPDGGGGILFKAPKKGQDRRIDMPTIGPATVKAAKLANLDGIVVETGGVLLLEADKTIDAANGANIFLWVRDP